MIIAIFGEHFIGTLEKQFFRDKISDLCPFEFLTLDDGHQDETFIAVLILLDVLENDWYLSQFIPLCRSIGPLGIELAYNRLKVLILVVDGKNVNVEDFVCVIIEEIVVALHPEVLFEVLSNANDAITFS